jgi:hypothetical protein
MDCYITWNAACRWKTPPDICLGLEGNTGINSGSKSAASDQIWRNARDERANSRSTPKDEIAKMIPAMATVDEQGRNPNWFF